MVHPSLMSAQFKRGERGRVLFNACNAELEQMAVSIRIQIVNNPKCLK